MTENFLYLIDLAASGACGTSARNITGFTAWEDVLRLAEEQSVYYIVLYSLKRMTDCSLDQMVQAKLFAELQSVAISAFAKRLRIIKLLEDMEASGIRTVLLKGYIAASLYSSPDSRLSGDTDIYVEREDEKRAQDFLRQEGFTVLSRENNSHHSNCSHPELGHLELHTSFYDEIAEKVWFCQTGIQRYIEEPYEKIVTTDGSYYSLGKTDNLIFLALHMIKHFILEGMNLRQVMDFTLYYLAYQDILDLPRFWNLMEELKYSYFIKTVLYIAKEYFHLPVVTVPGSEAVKGIDAEAILDDMETGGGSVNNDKLSRSKVLSEFNRLKLLHDRGKSGYRLFIFNWNAKGFLLALFPSRKHLAERFPYVQRSVLLVPAAWIHRVFTRGIIHLLHRKNEIDNTKDEDPANYHEQERITLFRQIKII